MAQSQLASFYSGFYARTDLLLRHFSITPLSPVTINEEVSFETLIRYSRGFLVNRLFHLWGEFCRHVVVASALGGYRTLGGVLLSGAPQIGNLDDILRMFNERSITGPRLRWGDPRWTVNNAKKIQPANLNQITLGIGAAPYDDFRRVRNFMVHSNPYTRSEFEMVAISYSLFGANAEDLLLHRLPGGGTVMESWVLDFQAAALNAVR